MPYHRRGGGQGYYLPSPTLRSPIPTPTSPSSHPRLLAPTLRLPALSPSSPNSHPFVSQLPF